MTEPSIIAKTIEFHGHMCPGLALGIRAAEAGVARVGAHAADNEIVAIVETDMCAVDAIQFLTGCTLGKGNLVHRDHGKNACTFLRRSDSRAVRVSMRAGGPGASDPGWMALFIKVRGGMASDEELARFFTTQHERSERILSAPIEDLYEVREVEVTPPPAAQLFESVECASCGEPTMETRLRRLDRRELCLSCFEEALGGTVAVASPTPLAGDVARDNQTGR